MDAPTQDARYREATQGINALLEAAELDPADGVIVLAVTLGSLLASAQHHGYLVDSALEMALDEARRSHGDCRKFLELRDAAAGGSA